MVEFVNKLTGTVMYVPKERVEEYKAAGHKPAAQPEQAPRKKTKRAR